MKNNTIPRYLFDRRDYRLLSIVNEVISSRRITPHAHGELYALFHPEGIKELAESRGLRIAYATILLLQSLTVGRVENRLSALSALRQEILDTAVGPMPRNTARVLLQIMKELVRAFGDQQQQLELAHDFRSAASGKPRIIRRELQKYHLLEMPEEWNQVAFDDHVHDANTKGRKTPTHLIMDAWIKGIRRLRVIYYNHISSGSATELIQAAQIMGITVRIGIEFATRFRNKYAQLIWVPRGFPDAQAFLCFLAEPEAEALMHLGRQVTAYQEQYVRDMLHAFNRSHRLALQKEYHITLPELGEADFMNYVAPGQASLLHLAKYIHARVVAQLPEAMQALRRKYELAQTQAERQAVETQVQRLDALDAERLLKDYLRPECNPGMTDPAVPSDDPAVPELLRLSPHQLIERLMNLHTGYRVTLNLSNMRIEDVLEILYDCEGRITRLEVFNLKDHAAGITDHIPDIVALQHAVNKGNVIAIKRMIRGCIDDLGTGADPDAERIQRLKGILHDIISMKAYYAARPLEARIGSDSTGGSAHYHGMGLVVVDTLPRRARHKIHHEAEGRLWLPIAIEVAPQSTYCRPTAPHTMARLLGVLRKLPGCGRMGLRCQNTWEVREYAARLVPQGNIVTLGGLHGQPGNGLRLHEPAARTRPTAARWRYLNSLIKNCLKVVLGFVPAFATFALTKEWWLLAYGGAFIWFGITGLRNIVQAVLGGGGWRRSPLLHWNDLISWSRITDSLLYTGFSVPLLDYVTKTVLLDRLMHITTANHPIWLYTFMALANGVYLSSHNILRGLQKGAVVGNFFRSVLSIPLAIGINAGVSWLFTLLGLGPAAPVLQRWAAIISKTASDVVAGLIEGTADRIQNIERRLRALRQKFEQILDSYAQLEMLLPETQTAEFLNAPDQFNHRAPADARDLAKGFYVHALDMLYFWMYQARARLALRIALKELSPDERQIILHSQMVLKHQRLISTLFIEGMLGPGFSKPLAFYLSHASTYMAAIQKIIRQYATPSSSDAQTEAEANPGRVSNNS